MTRKTITSLALLIELYKTTQAEFSVSCWWDRHPILSEGWSS